MAMRTDRFNGTPVAEAATLAAIAVFGLVAARFLVAGDISTEAKIVVGLPLAICMVAIVSSERQVVWIALGLCLAAGLIGIFSFGMPILMLGICLFLWWMLSARRMGRPVIVGGDLVWEMVGVSVILIALGLPIG